MLLRGDVRRQVSATAVGAVGAVVAEVEVRQSPSRKVGQKWDVDLPSRTIP